MQATRKRRLTYLIGFLVLTMIYGNILVRVINSWNTTRFVVGTAAYIYFLVIFIRNWNAFDREGKESNDPADNPEVQS
jgi:hypothetical protein